MIAPTQYRLLGNVDVWHDELGHGGTVNIDTDVVFATGPGGAPDYAWLVVPCPVCGGASWHPVGGGAAPREGQILFIRKLRRAADNIPGLPARTGIPPRRDFQAIKNWLRDRILEREPEGLPRFKLALLLLSDLGNE
jgi:hypothetical protein